MCCPRRGHQGRERSKKLSHASTHGRASGSTHRRRCGLLDEQLPEYVVEEHVEPLGL
jgi:hypothetical protein